MGIASSKVSVVDDGENKVLKMEKPVGDTNPIITIKGKELSGAKSFVVETDFKLERTSTGGETYFSLANASGTYAYRFYISVNSDNTISITDYRSGDSSKQTASKIGKLGDWIKLKLIYTVADGKASITLLINGTEAFTSSNHYVASTAPIAPDMIKTLRVNFSQKYFGNIYFDNLSIKATN
jgi:hypothetical protein